MIITLRMIGLRSSGQSPENNPKDDHYQKNNPENDHMIGNAAMLCKIVEKSETQS